MHVRFFNGNDPTAPADKPREVLMVGISPDQCPPPELHEAVRVASEADIATYGDAYATYESEQKAKQEAEDAAKQPAAAADPLQAPAAEAAPAAPELPQPPQQAPQPHGPQHERDRRGR